MTMLSLETFPTRSFTPRKSTAGRSGLHRLFAAAIVSDQFRAKLLSEPEAAMTGGYLGQAFVLTDQEKRIIKTVQANDLKDFAQKVNQALKGSQTPA